MIRLKATFRILIPYYSYRSYIYIYIPLIRNKIHNSLKIAQLNCEQLSVARICTQPREWERGGEKSGETEGIYAYVTKAIRRFQRPVTGRINSFRL